MQGATDSSPGPRLGAAIDRRDIEMITKDQSRRGFNQTAVQAAGSAAVLLAALALSPHVLSAQTPGQSDTAVRVGDLWVYDTKDEVTGFPKETYTQVVTEVTPEEIRVSTTIRGRNGPFVIIYDHDWNRIDNLLLKFKPNDGQGVRLPLTVGKEWRSEYESRNTQTGAATKGTVASKVLGQEMVTTAAGTFETFKIQTRIRDIDASDPSKLWEYENLLWFAPEANRWVRRALVSKFQQRVRSSTSEELSDFSRSF
jgi:hypothetical protein